MTIYITENIPALEQSEGNRRLRAIVEEILSRQSAMSKNNIDLVTSDVLQQVQREGRSFVILCNGRRQTAAEDQCRSKIAEYIQASAALQDPPSTREIEDQEIIAEECDDVSLDWMAGVEGLDELEQMIFRDDETLLMDTCSNDDLFDPLPVEDEAIVTMERGDDALAEDVEDLEALLLNEPLLANDDLFGLAPRLDNVA